MEKIFNPESIAIIGLSSKQGNIPRLVLENLIRWGYRGRIFGVNPRASDIQVNGIRMYKEIHELPIVPDMVFALIPARLIPDLVEACGKFGVKRMAIPSGGFNELNEEGGNIANLVLERARKYGIRFVGPNGITVANTANGLCLPFVPSYSPPKGGLSIITQSGGVGLMLWNLMADENVGMAKFASIGNKLDMDEVDFLEYFGTDPDTKIIGMYLESIPRGKRLIDAVQKIDKPVIILKSNTTNAGKRAAMSHTAALAGDDEIVDSAFERAGVIRIDKFTDFISVAKAFKLPPMKGKRMMIMSPAGGFTVMMADMCEKLGFEFADPGGEFYDSLKNFSNAGVINFTNPLDMGDIYDPHMFAHIFYSVMHNDNVDGGVFVSQWPNMPRGEDVFYRMFHTDLSQEATGTILSSGKPLAACLFGISATISQIKHNINIPVFDSAEDMLLSMKRQCDYHMKKSGPGMVFERPSGIDDAAVKKFMSSHSGDIGEEALVLLAAYGVTVAASEAATDAGQAVTAANRIGYPVVMKVISPDALHKTDVGGVKLDIRNDDQARDAFDTIQSNLSARKPGARFDGVRVMKEIGPGYDLFIGGKNDESFGPVVFFGLGGVHIEVFRDVKNVLCPSNKEEIEKKLRILKSYQIIRGIRGRQAGDLAGYIAMIERISHLLSEFPQIKELDMNPVRLLEDGSGVRALDARMRIG